ncbi:ribosomal protein L15 [Exidia glandulosa HHB12029]|uniref:Ribosomal protein L15 n=1 Tax=Exidia glandulosa HHB12029 TaxID=1314781 RepID=A0A165H8V7_EXIGL|nr:ribosomal protein L15 [Exidia glandulosa HHB12029]
MSGRFKLNPRKVGLFNLSPAQGSVHNRHRFGRGDGGGRGGTSGRGHKGQNARSGNGKPSPGFEGGQTPIMRKFPKRGFINRNERTYAPLNLDRVQHWLDEGRIPQSSKTAPLTVHHFLHSKCIHNAFDGVKILADGAQFLKTPIHLSVARASKPAIRAIEKLGGSVVCEYQNALALRDTIKGRTDRLSAAPTRREDIEWYAQWKNRGYLHPQVIQQNPQLSDRTKAIAKELNRFKTQRPEDRA